MPKLQQLKFVVDIELSITIDQLTRLKELAEKTKVDMGTISRKCLTIGLDTLSTKPKKKVRK